MDGLEEKIRALPPELHREVEAYVDALTARNTEKPFEPPEFAWAGALKEKYGEYDSVQLQHMVRGGGI